MLKHAVKVFSPWSFSVVIFCLCASSTHFFIFSRELNGGYTLYFSLVDQNDMRN